MAPSGNVERAADQGRASRRALVAALILGCVPSIEAPLRMALGSDVAVSDDRRWEHTAPTPESALAAPQPAT